jgi:hypothetical protein
MKTLRAELLAGKTVQGCQTCYDTERMTGVSPRTWANQQWGTNHTQSKLAFLEVKFSNLCNQKCRMCCSESSTAWIADERNLAYQKVSSHSQNPWCPDTTDFHQLRKLRLIGGEPLLEQDRCEELLSIIDEQGSLRSLELVIQTNGSICPRASLIRLLRLCGNLKFSISIDAYGRLNEYIRCGSDWSSLLTNLQWFRDFALTHARTTITITPAVSLYNINELWRLEDYLETVWSGFELFYGRVDRPSILRSQNLPCEYKTTLIQRYRARTKSARSSYLTSILMTGGSAVSFASFILWHDRLDTLRKQNLAEVNSELDGVIREYRERFKLFQFG